MRVLMFGWEFPPHISGGLGTACYGLTNSLGKEDVDVLFVVPKLHGDEPAERVRLISASGIRVNPKNISKFKLPASGNPGPATFKASKGKIISEKEEDPGLTYIEVPSGLSAYRSPGFEETYGIENWNYGESQQKRQISPFIKVHKGDPDAGGARDEDDQHQTYKFSGVYGPNLLTEVERYAQVAQEIAKRFSFDVIHAHDWMTYPAGIAAKEISGKPLVVHVHATEFDRSGDNIDTRVHFIELEGMQKADRVVTVSDWTRKIAIKKYKVDSEKVKVVHNGIIRKKKTKILFDSPLKHSPIVTFLGRVTRQKGPLYFVAAAKKVLDEIPDARFIVVGSGDLLPRMIQEVARAGMSSRFHFTGFLKGNDVDKIWSISNVYVMPSVSEPFGIAPLEAIQAGVPVIISKQSGVAEVMRDAVTVDFWNTDALAEAITSVLKYKSLYRTLKKNSRERIKSITWDRAAKKINTLYHELIAN